MEKDKRGNYHWNNTLIISILLLILYLHCLFNYEDVLKKGRNPNNYTRDHWYDNLVYIFDTWFGKAGTVIILGTLVLIFFFVAWHEYLKQKNKNRF
jgi:hypothetical protein